MAQIFTSLLLTSVIGTSLALILILLKPVTRKFFSASWHYYIWVIVLLTMILPIKLNLPERSVTTPRISEKVTITDTHIENTDTVIINTQPEQIMPEQPTQPEKVSTVQAIKGLLSGKVILFSFIWLIGAILLFLIKIISYLVFLIKIHKHSEIISCPEIKTYTNRKIKTRVSDTICSPLMIGIIRPTLLLPKTDITSEQLHNVLAHEMTHLKRNDILYKWFAGIVKCIHWFNLAIYFINKQINIDCEISCDLAAVSEMDEQGKKGYAETILSLLTHNSSKAIPLTTGMTGDKKTLKRRFYMIRNKINISKKARIISVILAVVLCIGTILASGIINGKINTADNILINVNTDEREGNEFNFLMIGIDDTNRVDAVLAFNFDGNTLTCMNIPRNIDLAISGDAPVDNSTRTLSILLAEENGDQKVIDTIKETLGIPVHYYAKVKMDVIADVVDYVGGIEFDVPYNMSYDDPAQDLHIDLKEGKQVLNGKQVEHLLRFRDRRHANGDEIRVMTWHSVIKQFLNQAVIGNKIGHIPDLYETATKNIKTNYPLDSLIKDFNYLKNINRNNIVIENIRGRNANLNGYFVFHINYVESKPLLDVFASASEGINLISAITYTNDVMGFTIKVPEQWKSKYEVIQFDNQVAFYHKDIFLKYGKGSGNLFRITKIEPPTESNLEALGEPSEYLYFGKHFAYVWSVASDVQYPIWDNRDDEDAELSNSYKDMLRDLDFIKGSFTLIENQEKAVIKTESKITSQNSLSNKTSDISDENDIAIKSTVVSDEEYSGFAHLEIENISSEKMQNELNKIGVEKLTSNFGDLSSNYIVGEYSYKNNLKSTLENIMSDENGNISIYFDVNADNLVGISFYDAETKSDVGSYKILANGKNAYTFLGFDTGKKYVVDIQGETQGTWKVEGEYIIY